MIQNNNPLTADPRDLRDLDGPTGNIYLSVAIISKRANQIAAQTKDELQGKLSEFASEHDNLEEVFENREQIEISSHYERMPKPTLLATKEFLEGKVYFRSPENDTEE